jgi:hypothetical protein
MSVIYVYGFTGKYTGSPEYDYQHPELGATHKCMLFLRQDEDADLFTLAEAESRKYGFEEFTSARVGKLDIEALNSDSFRGFSGFYEEALENGSALVFYPNA